MVVVKYTKGYVFLILLAASGIKDKGKRPVVTLSRNPLRHFTKSRMFSELFV
jgi:hypothetical protein